MPAAHEKSPHERPLIGVTLSPSAAGWVYPLYALAIARAGGRAVKWASAAALDVDRVDGVVIGAGDGQGLGRTRKGLSLRSTPGSAPRVVDTWALEMAFADAKPILAVGFGAQRLNAALGGTSVARPTAQARMFDTRDVRPLTNSLLADVLGAAPLRAHTLATAVIDQLGLGLHVAGRDEVGVIQAIERARAPLAIGVQWRPEHRPFDPRMGRLFEALIAAARGGANGGRGGKSGIGEKKRDPDGTDRGVAG